MIPAPLRPYLRPESLFFLAVGLLLLVLFRERAFYDPGSLWHVKVGEIIIDNGYTWPRPWTDPFTYTHASKTWIPQQWGGEVVMALAHRAGGLDTMLLGFCLLVAGLFTWVFARMRSAGTHWTLAAVLTGAALFVGAFHYFARPHMVTIVLLGWTMGCLIDFDRGRAGLGRLAGLIPLFVIWTNIHGGVMIGIATLGAAIAGWGLLFLFRQDSPIRTWRTAWVLAAIGISCLLTPFDNPFGMEMIHTWQRLVGSEVIKEVVNEHKPLDLTQRPDQLIAGYALLYIFLLAGTLPKRPRVTWLIPFIWLVLTLKGIRQGPLFVITASVAVADLWPHTVWHGLLKKYGDSLAHAVEGELPGWRAFVLPVVAVAAVFSLQASQTPVPVIGRGWARLHPDMVPVKMTPHIREYIASTNGNARVFNDANLGGYLIYHFPEMKIFMDDRFELYGDQWTQEYVEMYWYRPELIEGWMDQYELDLALVVTSEARSPNAWGAVGGGPLHYGSIKELSEKGSALDTYLATSSRWTEVARTRCAVLYRRAK